METEKLRYYPCTDCGCRDYSVHSDGTYIQVICTCCGKFATEGYGSSAWELLRKKQLRGYPDDDVLDLLEFWEKSLAEAREKNDTKAIMSCQNEVNILQGETLRRNITDKILQRQKEKEKREKEKKRRYRFENRIKR